jgi:two-component system chemotaxis response regulator CheY
MAFTGTILLADDEPHIRKFLGLLLKQLGSPTVIEATNGQEAVAAFESQHPDLVLLDVNMPFMDGLEALKKIREIDPDSVVIMLTSVTNRSTVEEAAGLGATSYLRKDLPKKELLEALEKTIAECFTPDSPETP